MTCLNCKHFKRLTTSFPKKTGWCALPLFSKPVIVQIKGKCSKHEEPRKTRVENKKQEKYIQAVHRAKRKRYMATASGVYELKRHKNRKTTSLEAMQKIWKWERE